MAAPSLPVRRRAIAASCELHHARALSAVQILASAQVSSAAIRSSAVAYAIRRRLREAAQHDRLEIGRHRRAEPLARRHRLRVQRVCPQTSTGVVPSNTGAPGQQEVRDRAERVEVAARVERRRAR